MTTRNDVERLAQEADNRLYTSDIAVPYKLVRDLCRAWLALDAAPEAGVYVIGTGDGEDLLTLEPRDRQDREVIRYMRGRVRLVATPASGGPRE